MTDQGNPTDDEDDGDLELVDPENPYPRDRDRDVADRPLSPMSLVGSYFRAPDQDDPNAEAQWLAGEACRTAEGIVVAQPFASSVGITYLVEFYGAHGMLGYQRLVDIDRMMEQRWTFYDTEAWLTRRPLLDQAQATNEKENETT